MVRPFEWSNGQTIGHRSVVRNRVARSAPPALRASRVTKDSENDGDFSTIQLLFLANKKPRPIGRGFLLFSFIASYPE